MPDIEDSTPDVAAETAGRLRVVVGRLRRRLQDESSVDGLGAPEASALARLEAMGPASASRLAGQERVRPQSMAKTLAALEERGLVRREPDPDDARSRLVHLTDSGHRFGRGARATRAEWLRDALAHRLDARELTVVAEAVGLLERIVDE